VARRAIIDRFSTVKKNGLHANNGSAANAASAQAGDPTGGSTTSRTTRIALILAALISRFRAGGGGQFTH
ncbi:MAG: hypothetical protein ACLQE9_22630, partial [Roseiarcus sp.]